MDAAFDSGTNEIISVGWLQTGVGLSTLLDCCGVQAQLWYFR
ncbi:hypothetical protein [Rhodoferax sp. U2-2l]|nr:hypothetical protein [Rhodoferax sp. U2-2l]